MLSKVTSEATSEATPEATPEATSEASDVEINDDISTSSVSDLSDSLLQVQNFAVVRSKSRFVEVKELRSARRQQEFDNSTQRKFSQYEHVLTEAEEQRGQQKGQQERRSRGRGRDRSRGRGRDVTRARGERSERGEGQRGEEQRGEEQRGERAVTPTLIQTEAGLFAAFHM